MIPKTIIVVLTVAALVSGAVTIAFCVKKFPPLIPMVSGHHSSESSHSLSWGRIGSVAVFVMERRPGEERRKLSITRPEFSFQDSGDTVLATISIWIAIGVTSLLAVYPIIAFIRGPLRRWREERLRRQGCCFHCEYDLTGNISGVCPECGTAVADNAAKIAQTDD